MEGVDGATEITEDGGTLQMNAAVSPANASKKSVTWSVLTVLDGGDETGHATIDSNGLLTAVADGTISVVATAQDGSEKVGELVISISNQTSATVVREQAELTTALMDSNISTIILDENLLGFEVTRTVTIIGGSITPQALAGHTEKVGIWVHGNDIDVVIDGVTISGADTGRGIEVTGAANLTVTDTSISSVVSGIYLNPGAKLTATGNTIDNTVAGIGSENADLTGDIAGNTFTAFTSEAIGLYLPVNSDGSPMTSTEAEALADALEVANGLSDGEVIVYGYEYK